MNHHARLWLVALTCATFILSIGHLRAQHDGMPQVTARPAIPSGLMTRSVDEIRRNPESVTVLDLSRQRLTELPSEVLQCVNLQTLVLASNDLRALPAELSSLRQLRSINLSGNKFESFPSVLLSMPWVEVVILRNNTIANVPALGAMSSLATLDLRGNPLDSIADNAFAGLVGLRVLDLSSSNLRKLPESIGECVLLSDVNVSRARLTTLPKAIENLVALQRIDAGYNQLTALPDAILGCGNVLSINVSNNKITQLPARLYRLRTLETLKANANRISALPDTLFGMQLRRLELDSNQLTTLPETIGDLTMLDVLSVRFNKLSSVPASIGRCQNLSILDIGGNAIRSLPVAELAQIPGLTRITIADNASPYSSTPDEIPSKAMPVPRDSSSPSVNAKKPAPTQPQKRKKP